MQEILNDCLGAPMCTGTGYVAKRSAIAQIGGSLDRCGPGGRLCPDPVTEWACAGVVDGIAEATDALGKTARQFNRISRLVCLFNFFT